MRRRGLLRIVMSFALLCALLATATVADADNVRFVIGAPTATHDSLDYPVTVLAKGGSALAILPYETRLATLEVNGIALQTVGRDWIVGHQPLAHGGASLVLAGLAPGDRVVIRVRGTREPPRVVADGEVATASYAIGIVTGMLYGLLATAMLVQIVALFGFREWASLWYLGALGVMLFFETMRGDVLHVDPRQAPLVLVACGLSVATTMVGFTAAYLGLYAKARSLFWWIVAANIVPGIVVGAAQSLLTLPASDALTFVPPFVGNGALVLAAALRWRAGYRPASLLLLGLCALCTFFALKIVVALAAVSLPIFDWWGLDAAIALDVMLFSAGIAYRDRFAKRVQSEIELELLAATFAAAHDPLTGLLNRRGLEMWLAAHPTPVATLLYLDIDGFKVVNDRGGHAAGDDTLRLVARIMRHAVREEDQLARMGGDEFVVILRELNDRNKAAEVVTRIAAAVGAMRPLGERDGTRIGISIGIGQMSGVDSFSDALSQADAHLYRLKNEHRALARLREASGDLSLSLRPEDEAGNARFTNSN